MTTEGRLDEFHARLEDAERRLLALARAREDDDVPYWYLLGCARGLHRDEDVVQTRFDMLRKVAPDHRRGHSHVLRYVSPKWYGSPPGDGRLRLGLQRAPGGRLELLHGIVAEALVEGAVSFIGSGPPDVHSTEAFWADQRSHDQLQIAYRSFATGADDHAAPWRVRDLNTFVYAAAQTGCSRRGAARPRGAPGPGERLPVAVLRRRPSRGVRRNGHAADRLTRPLSVEVRGRQEVLGVELVERDDADAGQRAC